MPTFHADLSFQSSYQPQYRNFWTYQAFDKQWVTRFQESGHIFPGKNVPQSFCVSEQANAAFIPLFSPKELGKKKSKETYPYQFLLFTEGEWYRVKTTLLQAKLKGPTRFKTMVYPEIQYQFLFSGHEKQSQGIADLTLQNLIYTALNTFDFQTNIYDAPPLKFLFLGLLLLTFSIYTFATLGTYTLLIKQIYKGILGVGCFAGSLLFFALLWQRTRKQ